MLGIQIYVFVCGYPKQLFSCPLAKFLVNYLHVSRYFTNIAYMNSY